MNRFVATPIDIVLCFVESQNYFSRKNQALPPRDQ